MRRCAIEFWRECGTSILGGRARPHREDGPGRTCLNLPPRPRVKRPRQVQPVGPATAPSSRRRRHHQQVPRSNGSTQTSGRCCCPRAKARAAAGIR
jgi:hypothetical protein